MDLFIRNEINKKKKVKVAYSTAFTLKIGNVGPEKASEDPKVIYN